MTLIGEGPATTELALGTFVGADGQPLSGLRLRYRVVGNLDAARENGWILVFHALTGSADVEAWWGPLIGPGRALDTSRHAIVSREPAGELLRLDRTAGVGDRARRAVSRSHPGRSRARARAAAGTSRRRATGARDGRLARRHGGARVGAAVAACRSTGWWSSRRPAATSAQAIAWNTVQRMAIEADPAWRRGRYLPGQGPTAGLAAARALAMITYRSGVEFDARFGRTSSRTAGRFDVDHYLRRQGRQAGGPVRRGELHRAHARDGPARRGRPRGGRPGDRRAGEDGDRGGGGSDLLYCRGRCGPGRTHTARPGWTRGTARSVRPSGHDAFLIEWDQVEAILREA